MNLTTISIYIFIIFLSSFAIPSSVRAFFIFLDFINEFFRKKEYNNKKEITVKGV